ncbi:HAD family hydrolase [Croceicoccus naphthovorans]|nr:HAD family phosphatase [Croceicoccus naphthovorans]MBB3989172.1 2-haloacid dehalogenase [Croceicoccus naphthovorans]
MVETVVFDVGRVLFRWDLRYLYGKLIDDPDELEWFVSTVVTEAWHFEHDAGRDLAEMIAEKKLQYPNHAHLIDAYATRFVESIPGPVPGSLELVERLDDAGVPLFAITNFADSFWAEFRSGQPIFDRFRDIVVSGTEKLAKPDPAIFDLAAERFGIDPATALFIDDNPANIAAARGLGWQVYHFHDAAALKRDLVARGLLAS